MESAAFPSWQRGVSSSVWRRLWVLLGCVFCLSVVTRAATLAHRQLTLIPRTRSLSGRGPWRCLTSTVRLSCKRI